MQNGNHKAEAKIEVALKVQAELIRRIQEAHTQYQDPRSLSGYRWMDLGSMVEFNRRLAEAIAFVDGRGEGETILAEVSAELSK